MYQLQRIVDSCRNIVESSEETAKLGRLREIVSVTISQEKFTRNKTCAADNTVKSNEAICSSEEGRTILYDTDNVSDRKKNVGVIFLHTIFQLLHFARAKYTVLEHAMCVYSA